MKREFQTKNKKKQQSKWTNFEFKPTFSITLIWKSYIWFTFALYFSLSTQVQKRPECIYENSLKDREEARERKKV